MFPQFYVAAVFSVLCLCSRVVESTKWTPKDYLLDNTTFPVSNEMYAGYMPLSLKEDNDEGAFFFWLVKQPKLHIHDESNTNPRKLLIWLNGGPGCTSLLGLIMEHGPFRVVDDPAEDGGFKFVHNKYSWSEEADVLYVEQPIRTGFSLASEDARPIRKEKEVAEDFAKFLGSLMEVFTEYQSTPLFIAGESYAGFYIPWISRHILRLTHSERDKERVSMSNVNLQGIAIGNGAIDYAIQELSYAEYAYYHGLIPLQAKERLETEWRRCMDSFQQDSHKHFLSVGDFDKCDLMGKTLAASGHPNEYNVETINSYDALLFGDSTFMRFFNDPTVQTWLHVRGGDSGRPLPGLNFAVQSDEGGLSEEQVFVPAAWKACNEQVDVDMSGDHPTSSVPAIRYVANHIRVLLYNGEFDLNCNFLGTQHTLERSLWGVEGVDQDWREAERALWIVDGEGAGQHQQLGNLSFLIVKGAGHLMPMDKPKEALDMVHRFLSGKSFADRDLPAAVEYSGASLPGESVALTSSVPEEGHGSRVLMLLVIVALALWIANSRPSQQRKKHHTSGSEEGEVIQAGGSSWLTNPSYQQAELGYQRLEVQGSDTR